MTNLNNEEQKCKFPNRIQRALFHDNMLVNGFRCMPTRISLLSYEKEGVSVNWDNDNGLTVRVEMEKEGQQSQFLFPIDEWIPNTFQEALIELGKLRILDATIFSIHDLEEADSLREAGKKIAESLQTNKTQ